MLNRPLRGVLSAALAAGTLVAVSTPAHAALGGAPMTTPSGAAAVTTPGPTARVESSAMASPSSSTAATARYVVRATQLSSGTTVREYIGADGNVFAIAWNGPSMPDLQGLLGNYFPQYASGVKAVHAARHSRGPVAVESSDLVVHSGGHMGSFFGQAWLPNALPAGMTGADVK